MLDVRYDASSRTAFVKVRQGRGVRSRRLSEQAVADYDRTGKLVAMQVEDLDETAAEFIRTSDEETLLRVIAALASKSKAGTARPEVEAARPARASERPARAKKPAARPRGESAKPRGPRSAAAPAAQATAEDGAAKPKRRRRRRPRGGGGGASQPAES